MRYVRTFSVALLVLCATGCIPSLESPEPPQRTYWLEPTPAALPPGLSVHTRVSVVPGLKTDRILILEPDRRLNHFAGAFWTDRLPLVLQSVLTRALAATPTESDVQVDVLIERFFAVGSNTTDLPSVVLLARVEDSGGRVCVVELRADPHANHLRDIVDAHQRLVDDLTKQIGLIAASLDQPCPPMQM